MAADRFGSLGAYVRRLRMRAGLSQEELAERAGVAVDTIGALERGLRRRLYPRTARALADAFGLAGDDRLTLIELAQGGRASAALSPRSPLPAAQDSAPDERSRERRFMPQPGLPALGEEQFPSSGVAGDREAVLAPLAMMPPPVDNLPSPLTSFVGRVRERADVAALLGIHRLVTLVAIGGSGKTRLAVEVARAVKQHYPEGVWLVDLAAHAEADVVPRAVAAALGLREDPRRSWAETLAEALQSRCLLLVLDNCEHLVEACARLVEGLLTACPRLTVLTTSREPLRLTGEQAVRLQPLPVPDEVGAPGNDLDSLLRCDAVRLLVERVTARNHDFQLTPRNAPAIAEICRRLDGLPLALELAAARSPAMTVEQLAARLDDRFRLLRGGSRTALPRQQTLRAMMDWSYDLLTPAEQVLFRRLAVFAGSFTMEAAETVCAYTAELAAPVHSLGSETPVPASPSPLHSSQVLDLLAALVERSLVEVMGQEPAGRYRMLETVHQYAAHHLALAGEQVAVTRSHAAYMLDLAEEVEGALTSSARSEALARLDAEHDNLRAALAWYASARDHAGGLRLAGALLWFWYLRGFVSEGRGQLEGILTSARTTRALPTAAGDQKASLEAAWAKALHCAGVLAWVQGDYTAARGRLEESRACWQRLGVPAGTGRAETYLGLVAWSSRDQAEARACTDAAVQALREGDDQWALAFALNAAGLATQMSADHEQARFFYEESASIFRSLDDPWGLSLPLIRLGWTARLQGKLAVARAALETALRLRRVTRDPFATAMALSVLGELEYRQGNLQRAETLHAERLALFRRVGASVDAAYAMHDLAGVLHALGNDDRARMLFAEGLTVAAARSIVPLSIACLAGLAATADAAGQSMRASYLFGAAVAALDARGDQIPLTDEFDWEGVVTRIKLAVAHRAAGDAWTAGRQASLEHAITRALNSTIDLR